MSNPDPNRDTVQAIEDRRFLLGFCQESTAKSFAADPNTFWEEDNPTPDKNALIDALEGAKSAIEPLETPITEWETEPLPDEQSVKEHIEAVTSTDYFYQTYGEEGWDIALVPIDKLIALQRTVVTDAHSDVPDSNAEMEEILQYTLPTERGETLFAETFRDDESRLGVKLTSRSPNISVTGMKVVEGTNEMQKQAVFAIRAPPNMVNITRYEDRLFLNNGYHRVYQLYRAGHTHVPALIVDRDSFPDSLGFDESIGMDERPPTVPDFDTPAAWTVGKRTENTTITIEATKRDFVR